MYASIEILVFNSNDAEMIATQHFNVNITQSPRIAFRLMYATNVQNRCVLLISYSSNLKTGKITNKKKQNMAAKL